MLNPIRRLHWFHGGNPGFSLWSRTGGDTNSVSYSCPTLNRHGFDIVFSVCFGEEENNQDYPTRLLNIFYYAGVMEPYWEDLIQSGEAELLETQWNWYLHPDPRILWDAEFRGGAFPLMPSVFVSHIIPEMLQIINAIRRDYNLPTTAITDPIPDKWKSGVALEGGERVRYWHPEDNGINAGGMASIAHTRFPLSASVNTVSPTTAHNEIFTEFNIAVPPTLIPPATLFFSRDIVDEYGEMTPEKTILYYEDIYNLGTKYIDFVGPRHFDVTRIRQNDLDAHEPFEAFRLNFDVEWFAGVWKPGTDAVFSFVVPE